MERGDHSDTGMANTQATPAYTISPDGKSITCNRCGRTSHNPKDVEHRFCGNCHVFHDDVAGHNAMDSANHFEVCVTLRGTVGITIPLVGATGMNRRLAYLSKTEAINMAVWLKVLADPEGQEFARVENEVRKPATANPR